MRILLDTHAWLWFYLGDPQLNSRARSLIENPDNVKLVSPASYWELAIKVSIGKIRLTENYDHMLQHAILDNGFAILPIEIRHAVPISNCRFHPPTKIHSTVCKSHRQLSRTYLSSVATLPWMLMVFIDCGRTGFFARKPVGGGKITTSRSNSNLVTIVRTYVVIWRRE